jgi:monoamine oxidase
LNPGKESDPYSLSALVNLGFAGYETFDWGFDQQMTMFQPVGGMDQIAKGFERQVGNKIKFSCEVKEIRKTPNGVRIVYTDESGNQQEEVGDYCICTIPLPGLRAFLLIFPLR